MQRRRYTREFKDDTAQMLIMEGPPLREVSERLGVRPQQLSRWKREYLEQQEGKTSEGEASPKAMAAEIADLRKQLARSDRINLILKKTVGYFSKED